MSSLENRLTSIGYNLATRPSGCWRVERIGPPSGERHPCAAAHPVRSRALSRWLERLCDRAPSAAYRIRPAAETK
jgi:hypothetical protein